MNTLAHRTLLATLLLVSACKSTPVRRTLPPVSAHADSAWLTLVWVGTGTSYRETPTGRVRTPGNDYEFTVTQRRYRDHWESIKELHRRNPAYDGAAGPRDQTYHFRLALSPAVGDSVPFALTSTLGAGHGAADTLFRRATMSFAAAGVSRFAPYNRYRITQAYNYQAGELTETVALFKRADTGRETPFVTIDETARLFIPGSVIARATPRPR